MENRPGRPITRAREYAYTTKAGTRMTGRRLNLTTGQRLGSFEVHAPRALRAATDCGRDCILELVGRRATSGRGSPGA